MFSHHNYLSDHVVKYIFVFNLVFKLLHTKINTEACMKRIGRYESTWNPSGRQPGKFGNHLYDVYYSLYHSSAELSIVAFFTEQSRENTSCTGLTENTIFITMFNYICINMCSMPIIIVYAGTGFALADLLINN